MLSLFKEIKHQKSNSKGIFFIICFRTSNFFTRNIFLKIVGLPIRILYKIIVQWLLGIDIPDTTKIGYGFKVFHGQSLIVNSQTIIGSNVTLRHCTTIGNSKSDGGCPQIGDNVEVGANTVIVGEITIGNNSIIGAGSVVIKDVPPFSIVVGNPAKLIKTLAN